MVAMPHAYDHDDAMPTRFFCRHVLLLLLCRLRYDIYAVCHATDDDIVDATFALPARYADASLMPTRKRHFMPRLIIAD